MSWRNLNIDTIDNVNKIKDIAMWNKCLDYLYIHIYFTYKGLRYFNLFAVKDPVMRL